MTTTTTNTIIANMWEAMTMVKDWEASSAFKEARWNVYRQIKELGLDVPYLDGWDEYAEEYRFEMGVYPWER